MGKINILDCTLRDGGYINDWKFGNKVIKNMLKDLVDSNVEYVEVGFLRNCESDDDVTVFNNVAEINPVLPEYRGNTKFVAMALHNKYNIENLEPYDGTSVDAIRVTFHDYDIDEGLEYVKKVIAKGYKCFCNPINIMGYSDEKLLELIKKVNEIKPFGFSIVDTFGSMDINDLSRIYLIVEHNLDKSIVVGLHLHENLMQSFSLAQNFIQICSPARECIIDGSLMGMGRVPGNLCIELIVDYLNKLGIASYNLNPILDAIDDYIVPLRKKYTWGYSTAYALSAKYNLHRNYAEFLLNKGDLRAKEINQILSMIDNSKKTAYDIEYVENLYAEYQNKNYDDRENIKKLKEEFENSSVLVLAPGNSIVEYMEQINAYIKNNNPKVITVNFESDLFKSQYSFYTNNKRYDEYKSINNKRVIITSNIDSDVRETIKVNFYNLAFKGEKLFNNSAILLFNLFISMGIKDVAVAGFDGYNTKGNNYLNRYMERKSRDQEYNEEVKVKLNEIMKQLNINFITPTLYVRNEANEY